MAKLGSEKHPAIVRVQTEERALEMLQIAEENGWHLIAGVEPEKPEDISDIQRLIKIQAPPYKQLASNRSTAVQKDSRREYHKTKAKRKLARKSRKKSRRG